MKTGVEHWKSNYRKANDDLNQHRNGLSRSVTDGFGRSNIYRSNIEGSKNSNPLGNGTRNNSQISNGNLPINGNNSNGGFNASQRSNSAVRPGVVSNSFRPDTPAWSKNVPAYSNRAPTGVT